MSPSSFLLLFLCAAALSLGSAMAGGLFTLWVMHVTRTGAHPFPNLPSFSLFRRKPDEDDEPTNGKPQPQRRVGP